MGFNILVRTLGDGSQSPEESDATPEKYRKVQDLLTDDGKGNDKNGECGLAGWLMF